MAGYRAVATLGTGAARPGPSFGPARAVAAAPDALDPSAFEDLVAIRAPSARELLDRLDRLGELWAQATFYLFSADSWR